MFLTLCSYRDRRERIDILAHKTLNLIDLPGEVGQGILDRGGKGLEGWEVLVVRRSLLHLFPQELNRVVVR